VTRLPGSFYSRNAEAALERGECVDPESIDVSAAVDFADELQEAIRLVSGRCEECGEPCNRSMYSCGNCHGGE